jgi:hypothetical protein
MDRLFRKMGRHGWFKEETARSCRAKDGPLKTKKRNSYRVEKLPTKYPRWIG